MGKGGGGEESFERGFYRMRVGCWLGKGEQFSFQGWENEAGERRGEGGRRGLGSLDISCGGFCGIK